MTFFQTRVPLSLSIVNIMQPYQFGKYKTNTSTCYNNNITLDLDHKLFKKTMGILSCYNPSLHIYIHILNTHSVLPCPSLGIIFLITALDWVQEPKAAQVSVPSLFQFFIFIFIIYLLLTKVLIKCVKRLNQQKLDPL